MHQPAAEIHPGILFSRSDGTPCRRGTLAFWFLRKSKRVWFRLPERLRTTGEPLLYRHRGRPILHARSWASLPWRERTRLGEVILWGDEVAAGWGMGPDQTNHYLCIWTRWSFLHPGARAHPEAFSAALGSGSSS